MVLVRLATGTGCSGPDWRLTPRTGIEKAACTPAGQGGAGAVPAMTRVEASVAVTVATGGPPDSRSAARPPNTTTRRSAPTQRLRWLRRARWRGPRRRGWGGELTALEPVVACRCSRCQERRDDGWLSQADAPASPRSLPSRRLPEIAVELFVRHEHRA